MAIDHINLTVLELPCRFSYNHISPCVKACTVGNCLVCSKCRVLWEINLGSENSNLRFTGLMSSETWALQCVFENVNL